MQKPLSLMAALGLAVTLAMPAKAQDANTVVATVGDTEITLGHMIVARATLPEQYQQLPDAVLFEGILKQLIEQTVLADSFDGVLPPRVPLSLENESRSLRAGERVEQILNSAISPELVQAAYDKDYADAQPEKEFNASHILVETKEEALALIVELEGGADFSALAREKSTGPSGPSGGSLGWFGKGKMVPAFEAAVLEMEDGTISEPVETQYGWHVLRLNETRSIGVPKLKAVRAEIEEQLRGQLYQSTVESLIADGNVDQSGATGIDPAILKNLDLVE